MHGLNSNLIIKINDSNIRKFEISVSNKRLHILNIINLTLSTVPK